MPFILKTRFESSSKSVNNELNLISRTPRAENESHPLQNVIRDFDENGFA